MTQCKGRQDDNGESFNDNNSFSSPQHRPTSHGEHSDSPSQHDSRDFETSSKSRETHRDEGSEASSKSRETHRDKDPDQERGRRGYYHDDYESTRISGFDVAPSAYAMLVGGVAAAAGQVPGTPAAIPGMFSNAFALPVGQTTRHARHAHQVYVGGLPPTVNEEGAPVKVRRPSDYNPSLTAALGSIQPCPNLNLAAVRPRPGSAGGLERPDCIFVGGFPYSLTEQIRPLLETFGRLRGFDLVKDRETGNSKGYAFCVYEDLLVTDIVCATLNGIRMGDMTLIVRRASQGASQAKLEQETILLYAQQQVARGSSPPNPIVNGAAVGPWPGSAGGLEGPDCIFVGGLPYYFTEKQIRQLLEAFGHLRGFDLVKDTETGISKGYAFCVYEDLFVTDTVCATLNGIRMGDRTLMVRRASQGTSQPKPGQETILFHAQQKVGLGSSRPNPNPNLAAVGPRSGSAGGLEGPDCIFVGGLPYYFTEKQIRQLLETFGHLRGFDLVKDTKTGNSKGYAFCVYEDLSVTDTVCAALNGIPMGDKILTVRGASQGASQPKPEQETILLDAQQQVARGLSQPNPNLNLAAVGLRHGSAGGLEGPNCIFVGGLPYYFTEKQIRQLLETFGRLWGFDLVKDREMGNSKGYAFCVYEDLSVIDIVCATLNGIRMGDRTLIVRRASQDASQPMQMMIHLQELERWCWSMLIQLGL